MATSPYLCIYSEQPHGYNVTTLQNLQFAVCVFFCENLSEYEGFQHWQGFIFVEIFVIEF